ncbi:MAG: XdhC family protein [Candidatus Latescibacterota bacterium]
MEDIVEQVAGLASGEVAALASLVWSSGSIPMSERAKVLVRSDGRLQGTIGGGCLEAEVLALAREVATSGRPHLTRYTMTEKQAGESGLNCGGTVRIYTEPVGRDQDRVVYAEVQRLRIQRRACVLATLLSEASSARLLLCDDGRRLGSLGSPAADDQVEAAVERMLRQECGAVLALKLGEEEKRQLSLAAGEVPEAFVEPFLPAPVLYVFGGGHVGAQVGRLAAHVGFRVVVIDDRPLFADRERHPWAADWVVGEMDEVFARLPIDDQSYLVACTRGHQHDEIVVEQAVRTPARYIGMLGSERKKLLLWKRIEARGGERRRLDQVYAPVGLNIGADTPEEIAVSVVAELVKVRRGVKREWKTKKAGR